MVTIPGFGDGWEILASVPNPWGEIPMFDGHPEVSPRVEQFMTRMWDVASRRDCVSRRHHYVPQAYLRAWSPDGRRVRVLHTQTGLDRFQSLKDTCVREDFYRVTDMQGVQHRQVEAMLAVIDDETATILSFLRAWKPGDDISFDAFMSLAVVVAFQENRTPQRRRFMHQIAAWQTERLQQPELDLHPDFHIDSLFATTYKAADQFSTRQLELWDDPKGRLITATSRSLWPPRATSRRQPSPPRTSGGRSRRRGWSSSPRGRRVGRLNTA